MGNDHRDMPECANCVLYGSRAHHAVQQFCRGCVSMPGARRYCLAFSENDMLKPVNASEAHEVVTMKRSACSGDGAWILLEWHAARRAYGSAF